ncbi:sodium:solute symporter family transporter [Denitromonas iodatirespirans]|uniref:Sodium/solute symporter n=1 Tax=Denitromonas iodatirespirans TaxID=2795389 RepID=A0A944H8Y7_DENI1|nr:sodium/solute symporter [Denitromonas iodatirespirans]MBT0962828.1 sodium/solute symporter [Denitromonas iodatirespirans]
MNALHPADYAIMAVYLLIVVVVCVRVTRRSPDADDLFLAGRTLGAGVIGLSLFASNISSTTLIGLPGAAWATGISVANYEWMAALVLVFTAVFVAPVLIGRRLTTVPELLEQRFDARLRKYLSGTSLILSVLLDTAGSLYAGALVVMLFVPGLSLGPTCAALALFAGIYTAAGGLRAVAYTDVLQSLVLLVGSTILFVLVFAEFDYSWAEVTAQVPADKLSLIRPLDDPALPWLGTLLGLPILGFYYWTMNQYVCQRLLGARDIGTAGRGALIAAALKLLPLFLMVLPGVMAVALFADLDRPDTVFPRLIATYAPPGLAGLMLAGLLAAIMSSVDSALNSASTLVICDFVQPRRPQLDAKALARLGRLTTLGLMVVAALWAPAIDRFPGLFAYLQQAFAYVTPPLVAVFALGMLSRRLSANAALAALATGHAVSAAWFVATQLGWLNLHFTLVAFVLLLITTAAAALWQTLLGSAPSTAQLDAVDARQVAPAPPGVRWGAAGLTLATAALVVAFW